MFMSFIILEIVTSTWQGSTIFMFHFINFVMNSDGRVCIGKDNEINKFQQASLTLIVTGPVYTTRSLQSWLRSKVEPLVSICDIPHYVLINWKMFWLTIQRSNHGNDLRNSLHFHRITIIWPPSLYTSNFISFTHPLKISQVYASKKFNYS